MPSVPKYQRQVGPTALPGVRVDANAPTAAFQPPQPVDLSGVVNASRQVDQIRAEEEQKRDQVEVSGADARAIRAKTARLYDPNAGAMNARGADAVTVSKAAQEAFRQDLDEIESTLSTDRQKQMFRMRANTHWADLGNQLGQHVSAQIKQHDNDTTTGHIQALTTAAVASWQDPNAVQAAIDDVKGTATDYWRRNGHGVGESGVDEFAQQHIRERVSAIRAAVFDQYSAAGQDLAAAAYFQRYRDDFVGKDREQAEKIAKAGSSRALAQSETSRILATHPESLTDAIAEAEKIEEPTVRDDVVRRIRQHEADKASDLLHTRQQIYQKASEIIEKSGGNMDAIPLRLRTMLLPGENEALQHRAEQIRHPKQFGDSESFYHLKNLAHISAESRTEFLKENIATGYPNLSDKQRSELLTLQYQLSGQVKRDSTKAANHPGAASGSHAAAPNVAATPVTPAKPYNPLAGIVTAGPAMTKTPTPAMLRDVQAKGPGYATYLRGLGYKIP